MNDKIKTFFSNTWAILVAVLGAAVGILFYYLNLKNKEVAAIRAKLDLVETQKQADLLETHIKGLLADNDLFQKEIDEHNKTLDKLQEMRKNLPDDHDPSEYWNK